MNVIKVLGGVACLSVLLGTGAWAEIVGGEPGTSTDPKDNVPSEIQRSTPSGGFGEGDSGPGSRSDALSEMKKEKPVSVTEQGLEQNAETTQEGGAARAAQELEQQGKEKMSHSGGTTEAAEDLKAKGKQSHKDISAQSAHKGMKKKLPKKELQQADPPVKE